MVIGEHSRGNDLEVNPMKAKQLTNMRASGKDEAVRLTPPRVMSLEQALAYIADDELVAVTPKRSEEHTSELQSLMRNSYAVFCLKKTNHRHKQKNDYSAVVANVRA